MKHINTNWSTAASQQSHMNPDRGIAIVCLESRNGCRDNQSGYLDVTMGCLKNQNQAPGPSKDIEKQSEIISGTLKTPLKTRRASQNALDNRNI